MPGFSRSGLVDGRAALAGSFSSTPTPGSVVVWKPTAAAARFSAAGALRSAADVVCAGGGATPVCDRATIAAVAATTISATQAVAAQTSRCVR